MEKPAETTGNLVMTAPKLVHTNIPSTGRVSSFSSLKSIDKINRRLTMQQKIMFRDACFGQFLNLGLKTSRLQFSGNTVYYILGRAVESPNPNEMWFLVGDQAIRFSMQEFCIVTGLKCGPCPKIDLSNVKGVRLVDEVFQGDMDLRISDIEDAFLRGSSCNETMVKLAMLYFLESVLLGRDKRAALYDNQHILLIDDFEQFQNYPWGRICYEMTVESLKKATPFSSCVLKGFPLAFLVWALEAIPSLSMEFAFKNGSLLPRICNWWSGGLPKPHKLVDFFKQKHVEVYTVLEPTEEEKRKEYLRPFVSPVARSSINSKKDNLQVDRRQIEGPKVGANDAGLKRKHKEELCLAQRKPKARYGDLNSLSSEHHAAPGPPEASHLALPASVEINDVSSSTTVEEQAHDVQVIKPPVFHLREEHAIFERIKYMLENSPQGFLPSPQSIAVSPDEINQAKCLLQPLYSKKFEQLANQCEELELSMELLLEAGHFPPCVRDRVMSFQENIARDIGRYVNNCRSISKFEKNKEESEVQKEELSKLGGRFDLIANRTAAETQKLEQLKKSMSSKEAEVKHLAETTKASSDAYIRNVLRLRKLEEEKQEAEKEKEKILNRWDEFKRLIGEHL